MTILREIRHTMTVGERARLNSPISARQRVEKVLKARESGRNRLRRRLLWQGKWQANRLDCQTTREIEHLKEQVAAAAAHADLVGQVVVWAAQAAQAANENFNVTNGTSSSGGVCGRRWRRR